MLHLKCHFLAKIVECDLPIGFITFETNSICNILNFGPNTYRHVPIDYDDYLDVFIFIYIGSKTPLHMNMMIVLYNGHKPILDDIYV